MSWVGKQQIPEVISEFTEAIPPANMVENTLLLFLTSQNSHRNVLQIQRGGTNQKLN